ncbi:MAG: inorganic diphosphatase [Firmicutes bacterium]|nr:inorganic diphosphatase [Alicyclobacillaceae bacterium]MCL6498220.1 inorganic diphosphatase [Bacillota bacterium]
MVVDVVVEIPRGSQNKYEIDGTTGRIRLDRVLYSPFHYPTEYGIVEGTLGEDGDPLDVLLVLSHPTFPGCVVRGRVVGMLEMVDSGEVDHKILAVAEDDPRYHQVRDLGDLSPHLLREIAHFFERYKELEGKTTEIGAWRGRDEAERVVADSIARFKAGVR